MRLGTMNIANHAAFGELVCAWALGTKPRPTTMDELKAQCAEMQCGAEFADSITKVQLVETPEDTLIIRLPRKSILLATQEGLNHATGASYPLPDFYAEVFGRQPQLDEPADFRHQRIADYTIGDRTDASEHPVAVPVGTQPGEP